MRLRASLFVVTVVSALSLEGLSRAEPTAPERETARTLVVSGREKRAAGALAEALADFERAHAIMHVPTTALDLGVTQEKLGLLVEARATLLESLRTPAQPGEPEAFKRARASAKKLADEIAPRLATLEIVVSPDATVRIDAAEIPTSSLGGPLKVNPGRHTLVVAQGTQEQHRDVELQEGETKTVDLSSSRASSKPARERAKASTPPPATAPSNTLLWVGIGLGGAGLITGSITGLMAMNVYDDVTAQCAGGRLCPPATHDDISRGSTFGTISTISFVVAAAGAVIVAYSLFSSPRAAKSAATLTRGVTF